MPTPKLQLLSRTQYDTDGSTTVWNFNFSGGYILQDHVKAYYDTPLGVRTVVTVTPAMLIGTWQLQITPAIPAGNVLTIYRATPKDNPMVDFADRGNISEVALDTLARQAIFVAAEASDDTVTANSDVAVTAAVAALASQGAAATSATNAAASNTSFKSVWLGRLAADPTLDGNGNAVTAGAVYLSTTLNALRVYNGTSWQTSYAPGGVVAGAITASGLTQATNRLLGRSTAGTGAVEEIATGSAVELVTGTLNVKAAGITAAMLSGAQSGSAPALAIRAWCVFNGALTGTNAPVSGSNVTSVTRVSTGRYLVTFTTPMTNADFSVSAMALPADSNSYSVSQDQAAAVPTTTTFSIRVTTQSATLTDVSRVHLQVVG